ncbi:MAG: sulfotransferase [Planctomycetota bacterium]
MSGPSLFIFGSERGGTTLFSALLSSHPQVYVLNDSFVYLAFVEAWAEARGEAGAQTGSGLGWKLRDRLRRMPRTRAFLYKLRALVAGGYKPEIPELEGLPEANSRVDDRLIDAYFARLRTRYEMFHPDDKANSFLRGYLSGLHPEKYAPGKYSPERGPELRSLLDGVFLDLVPEDQAQKPLLGEKTPRHLYCAPWLQHLYPDAKAITLLRNPLANVAGLHARMNKDLSGALAKYLSFFGEDYGSLYDGSRSLLVRYEDLIYETEDSLEKVASYLGLTASFSGHMGSSTRGDYIGDAIDPERDKKRMGYFSGAERERVLSECSAVIDRHYPDLERFL